MSPPSKAVLGSIGFGMASPDRTVYDPPFEDDLMFDTVEEQETSRGRPVMILLSIIVVLAFAGVVWVAYNQGVKHAANGTPPVIGPEEGPERIAAPAPAPAPAANNVIYDQFGQNAQPAPAPTALAPAAEQPQMDQITASAEPAPAQEPAPAPVPSTEPAPDTTTAYGPAQSLSPAVTPAQPAVDPVSAEQPVAPAPVVEAPPVAEVPAAQEPPPFVGMATENTKKLEREAQRAAQKNAAEAAAAKKKAEAALLAEQKPKSPQDIVASVTPPAPAAVSANGDPLDAPYTGDVAPGGPSSSGVASAPLPPAATPAVTQEPRNGSTGAPTSLIRPPDDFLPAAAAPETNVASAPAPAAPAAVEAPAAPAAAPSSGGSYMVQIGSYKSPEEAEQSWRTAQSRFGSVLASASPQIRKADLGAKGIYYRLQATGYADRSAAQSACAKIKASGGGCVVQAR